jgi:hypothetical protein
LYKEKQRKTTEMYNDGRRSNNAYLIPGLPGQALVYSQIETIYCCVVREDTNHGEALLPSVIKPTSINKVIISIWVKCASINYSFFLIGASNK